jgi:eukaryotic-like serine/threonine-protein kinase
MTQDFVDVGEVIGGRYRLEYPLGGGGIAVVWRAIDETTGGAVALRLVAVPAAERRLADALGAAAQALMHLSHPNVATVVGFGEHDRGDGVPWPYVVTEWVDGVTLHVSWASQRTSPWPQAVALAAQAASALTAAHQQGIVHGRLEPSKIMLTDAGVKVLDFEVAALLGDYRTDVDDEALGIPAFVAPERLHPASGPAGPAADVYALGIVLYRLLAGKPPWSAPTPRGLLEAQLRHDPAPLPALPGLPAQLSELCMRCLAKDPDERPSAATLEATLVAMLSGDLTDIPSVDAIAATHVALPKAGRLSRASRLAVACAVVAVMGLVGLAGLTGFPMLADFPGAARGTTLPSAAVSDAPGPVPAATATVSATRVPSEGLMPAGMAQPSASTMAGAGPSVTPQATATGKPPRPGSARFAAAGGVVEIVCDGQTASVVRIVPAAGYVITRLEAGPASEVRVILRLGETKESEIRARCVDGEPAAEVRETSQGNWRSG